MPKRKPKTVKEPVQVYLESSEKLLLDRLAKTTSLSRAEVLRRGLRSYGAEVFAKKDPTLALIREFEAMDWPDDGVRDVGINHDRHLADAYADTHEPKKPGKR